MRSLLHLVVVRGGVAAAWGPSWSAWADLSKMPRLKPHPFSHPTHCTRFCLQEVEAVDEVAGGWAEAAAVAMAAGSEDGGEAWAQLEHQNSLFLPSYLSQPRTQQVGLAQGTPLFEAVAAMLTASCAAPATAGEPAGPVARGGDAAPQLAGVPTFPLVLVQALHHLAIDVLTAEQPACPQLNPLVSCPSKHLLGDSLGHGRKGHVNGACGGRQDGSRVVCWLRQLLGTACTAYSLRGSATKPPTAANNLS